ncbi:MAG: DeoR/GlpR transcriptional regulator [Spirochaetales bacterium]|nr:DeoR/GlpR transcriptional regulator [Spirochaetales bacterium]
MVSSGLTEREREILRLLAEDANTSVAALAERLGVSSVTVRSDLNNLAQKGMILRTRGGATPAFHPNVIVRQNLMVEEKNRIAQAAAELVEDGDTIMIEAGTTTALVAKYLLGKRFVSIVTNSTLIIPFARINPGIHLTVVGGEFRPATESLVGPVALAQLERFHVRLAFVGTDGFSLGGGLTTHLVEGAEIVRKMSERSEETVLVADSGKHGRVGFVQVLPVASVARLVTDAGLPDDAFGALQDAGIAVARV